MAQRSDKKASGAGKTPTQRPQNRIQNERHYTQLPKKHKSPIQDNTRNGKSFVMKRKEEGKSSRKSVGPRREKLYCSKLSQKKRVWGVRSTHYYENKRAREETTGTEKAPH